MGRVVHERGKEGPRLPSSPPGRRAVDQPQVLEMFRGASKQSLTAQKSLSQVIVFKQLDKTMVLKRKARKEFFFKFQGPQNTQLMEGGLRGVRTSWGFFLGALRGPTLYKTNARLMPRGRARSRDMKRTMSRDKKGPR